MNTETPLDGNTTVAPRMIIISAVLLLVALTAYSLRIYTYVRPAFKLAGEDYIISLAVAVEMTVFALLVAASCYGLGRHSFYVTHDNSERALHCMFVIMMVGLWAATLARVSVAYMLLRLDSSHIWRITLWFGIIIQIVAVLGANICQLIQCRPLRSMWAVVPDARCWSPIQTQIWGYIFAGISILCDLLFALMPLPLVWNLTRPLLERILLAVLMALGLCATAVAALKIYHMNGFDLTSDFLRTIVEMALLSRVEELVLIVAACAPFLKSPTESFLRRFNVSGFRSTMQSLNKIVLTTNDSPHLAVNHKTSQSKGFEASKDTILHSQSSSEIGRNKGFELVQDALSGSSRQDMEHKRKDQTFAGANAV